MKERTPNSYFHQTYYFQYHGTGNSLAKLLLTNFIFCLLSAGLYLPWAKYRSMKYFFDHLAFDNIPFVFTGTAKEIRIGMLKLLAPFALAIGCSVFVFLNFGWTYALISAYAFWVFLGPFISFNKFRYRFSRLSWGGVHFGYEGDFTSYYLKHLQWTLFTVLTLGIYYPWMQSFRRRYLVEGIRFGDVRFKFLGQGDELFSIYMHFALIAPLSLGLYSYPIEERIRGHWYERLIAVCDDCQFYVQSMSVPKKAYRHFSLIFFGMLFSLGLAYPWIKTAILKYNAQYLLIVGNVPMQDIEQLNPGILRENQKGFDHLKNLKIAV